MANKKKVDAFNLDANIADLIRVEAKRRTEATGKRVTKSQIVNLALRKYLSRWYKID